MKILGFLLCQVRSKDGKQSEGFKGWFLNVHILKFVLLLALAFAAGLVVALDYLK